jgi:hypothetical protein
MTDYLGLKVIKNRNIKEEVKIKEGNPEGLDPRLNEDLCKCENDSLVQDSQDPEFMWCKACHLRRIVPHLTNDKPNPNTYTTMD